MGQQTDEQEGLQLPRSATRGRVRGFILLAVTLIGLWLCYRLTVPFLPAITWALALAILFAPAHPWAETKLKSPNLAATISVLLIAFMVVVPAIFVGDRLIDEATKGVVSLRTKIDSGEWRQALQAHRLTTAKAKGTNWEAELQVQKRFSRNRFRGASLPFFVHSLS